MSNIAHASHDDHLEQLAGIAHAARLAVARTLHVWLARRAERSMLRNELLTQPDSVLRDAGWTRAQARKEAAKPFWRH